MANLPPRPETPPKLRDDRRPLDDRDRDRRAAVPMGPSRPTRPLPERERVYVSSRTDTYIPGGHENRRENDRREYDSRDRDRERFRDSDRDRERRRSPRRWDSDRDRHYDRDRGPYSRRPVSPLRRYGPGPSRRDSRSPPRRRIYRSRSRSPIHRSRPRSRSFSPRRSPSKRIKLGAPHSIENGTHLRSPHRRSRSRDRSKSLEKRPPTSALPPSDSQQRQDPSAETPNIKNEEELGLINEEIPTIKTEDNPVQLSSSNANSIPQPLQSNTQEETKPSMPPKPSHSDPNEGMPSQPTIKIEEIKANTPEFMSPRPLTELTKQAIKVDTSEDIQVKKMDVDSPRLTPVNSNNPTRSPSPHPPRNPNEHQRPNIPTGPQRNWPNRSPPRGPRLHPRSNAVPPNQLPPYPLGRRDSRRPFPVQPTFPVPLPKTDHEIKLPIIPKYEKKGWETEILNLETELYKSRPVRVGHAHTDINHVQALQRAFHELQMASIDLHAAEGRRRVADLQLDKAKTGSLGIDASDIVEIHSPV